MRGHIVKRYNNSYNIVLSLGKDPATGKRKQQWVSVKGTRKDAEKRLSDLLHQLDTGVYMQPGKATVADYLEQWLKDYCQPNLAPRTVEEYQGIVRRHLKPTLGQTLLTQLKPNHIQRLYSQKLMAGRADSSGGLSNRSVRYIHSTLHKALEHAVKLGIIVRNPTDSVDVPRQERHEMRTMSESDIHILLEFARASPYYPLWYMAIFTGMRRSELLALRWCDADLILCQVSVTRTIHHLHNGDTIFRQPKTEKGRRLIALSPSMVAVLREHRQEQERIRQTLGLTLTDDSLVFSQIDGQPLLPDTVSHAWIKLAHRTGLKGIRLHDARHTHASLMLKQGIHPKIVQERLGHASIQITLDLYSHVAPGLQEAAANRFDEVLIITPKNEVAEKIG